MEATAAAEKEKWRSVLDRDNEGPVVRRVWSGSSCVTGCVRANAWQKCGGEQLRKRKKRKREREKKKRGLASLEDDQPQQTWLSGRK